MADTKLSDLPLGTLGTSSDILVTNGAASQRVKGTVLNHTGDVTGGVDGVLTIADDAVTTDKIANGDVTAAKLAPGVAGEANTVANIGGGSGVYAQNSGTEAQLKTLVGGSNVTLTAAADTITIDAATGGGGEANTVSNIGAGTGIFAQPNGTDSELKSLVGGTNVTLSAGADTITINSTASGGTDNTVSNIGAGAGVFAQRSGDDSELKSLVGGTNITITPDADTLTISASGTAGATPEMITVPLTGANQNAFALDDIDSFRIRYGFTITGAYVEARTAPTGQALIVDVLDDGVSIFSTRPQIDDGETDSTTAAAPVISGGTIGINSVLRFDIKQAGSTLPGTGIKVTLVGTQV